MGIFECGAVFNFCLRRENIYCKQWEFSLAEDFYAVVDQGDNDEKDQVAGQVDIEELLASLVFGARQYDVLDEHHSNEHGHLLLDAFVDETHVLLALETNVKSPGCAHQTCDLENLCTKRLR